MTSPLTVTRNDYRKNKKASAIYTPVGVARFLFDILQGGKKRWTETHVRTDGLRYDRPNFWLTILDPAIGTGRLTDPWRKPGKTIVGYDVTTQQADCDLFIQGRFEDETGFPPPPIGRPDLVLCNPPFNGAAGKRLYPEVFLEHIFKLYGPTIATILFVPMGFRLNQRRKSKRFRWLRDCGAQITSIVSLPLDLFEAVEFHAEVLIFNVEEINAHYFLPEEALQ